MVPYTESIVSSGAWAASVPLQSSFDRFLQLHLEHQHKIGQQASTSPRFSQQISGYVVNKSTQNEFVDPRDMSHRDSLRSLWREERIQPRNIIARIFGR